MNLILRFVLGKVVELFMVELFSGTFLVFFLNKNKVRPFHMDRSLELIIRELEDFGD